VVLETRGGVQSIAPPRRLEGIKRAIERATVRHGRSELGLLMAFLIAALVPFTPRTAMANASCASLDSDHYFDGKYRTAGSPALIGSSVYLEIRAPKMCSSTP
jgi:hypothetical protein